MNLREAKKHFRKHPCQDLNGRWVAYGVDGHPLGEVVYKKGVIISRKPYKEQKKKDGI